jgi:hypothetical protein
VYKKTIYPNGKRTTEVNKHHNNLAKFSLRIIYTNVDNDSQLITKHCKFLEEIKKHDTSLTIYPAKDNTQPYTDLNLIPSNDILFNEHFHVHNGPCNKCVVCIDIGLKTPFVDLKYTTTYVMIANN